MFLKETPESGAEIPATEFSGGIGGAGRHAGEDLPRLGKILLRLGKILLLLVWGRFSSSGEDYLRLGKILFGWGKFFSPGEDSCRLGEILFGWGRFSSSGEDSPRPGKGEASPGAKMTIFKEKSLEKTLATNPGFVFVFEY